MRGHPAATSGCPPFPPSTQRIKNAIFPAGAGVEGFFFFFFPIWVAFASTILRYAGIAMGTPARSDGVRSTGRCEPALYHRGEWGKDDTGGAAGRQLLSAATVQPTATNSNHCPSRATAFDPCDAGQLLAAAGASSPASWPHPASAAAALPDPPPAAPPGPSASAGVGAAAWAPASAWPLMAGAVLAVAVEVVVAASAAAFRACSARQSFSSLDREMHVWSE